MIPHDPKWDYVVRAYCPPNQGGGLLLETLHAGEASVGIEIAAYRLRMRRGEVDHIEVIKLKPPYGITMMYAREEA